MVEMHASESRRKIILGRNVMCVMYSPSVLSLESWPAESPPHRRLGLLRHFFNALGRFSPNEPVKTNRQRLLKVKFEVDDVLNMLSSVNLGHMSSYGHIAGIARSGRQLARKTTRYRMLLPLHVARKYVTPP